MPLDPGWVSVALVGVGLAGQASFWFFTQGQVAKDVAELKQRVEKDTASLNKRFDDASARSSEKMGEIQTKIGAIELKHSQIDAHLIYTDRRLDDLQKSPGRSHNH